MLPDLVAVDKAMWWTSGRAGPACGKVPGADSGGDAVGPAGQLRADRHGGAGRPGGTSGWGACAGLALQVHDDHGCPVSAGRLAVSLSGVAVMTARKARNQPGTKRLPGPAVPLSPRHRSGMGARRTPVGGHRPAAGPCRPRHAHHRRGCPRHSGGQHRLRMAHRPIRTSTPAPARHRHRQTTSNLTRPLACVASSARNAATGCLWRVADTSVQGGACSVWTVDRS